ncbi:ScbR family autoregulator-binding transcription factor [Gryllotalpicola koreensis]|uniref:HTH tetR-type domain-containing protein n=1 Tax=Gryllotalpicola koreensis TaxID=993086 RepID=A0ABP7ZPA0_9MICO
MTQQRASARRDEIIRAAAAEFDEAGYAGASLSSIAARLGRTKGAMSYHFSSKASLAHEVAEYHFTQWEGVHAAVRADGYVGLEAMILLSFVVATRFRDDVLVRAGIRLQHDAGLRDVKLPPPYVWWTGLTHKLLEEGRELGQIPANVDLGDAAEVLVEAFTGVQLVAHSQSRAQDIYERIERYWALFLPGLGVADGAELVKRLGAASAEY